MANRSTLVVSGNTWHGRLYLWWKRNSEFKNSDSYHENLCHYVRVVVFWGPLAVFLRWSPTPNRAEYVTPASVLTTAAALAGFGSLLVRYPSDILEVVLLSLGIGLLVTMTALSCLYIGDHEAAIRAWWTDDGLGTVPLKVVGNAMVYAVLGIPVAVYLVGAAVVLTSIFIDIVVLWTVLGGIGAFVVMMLLAAGLNVLVEKAKRDRSLKPKPEKEEGILKVGVRRLSAKKQRICPFIEVNE